MNDINKEKFLDFIDSLIELYGDDLILEVVRNKITSGYFDITEEA